jgi:hypothetical protein
MTNHLNTRGGDDATPERPPISDRPRPLPDREVPIEAARMSDVMQAWLDGEASADEVLEAGGATLRQVELWRRVHVDTARMRRVTAP